MQKCPWALYPPHSMSSHLRNTSCPPKRMVAQGRKVMPDRQDGTTKCRTPLLKTQEDAARVVHLLYSTSETGTLRHLAYSSRLTQLWLQRACCLLFFPQPISLPWLALEFVHFSYQVTVSHLQLWAEKLWTAFCFAGLEHRDNSTWSAEPRGDTREVALQLPGGLVLVATKLQSP